VQNAAPWRRCLDVLYGIYAWLALLMIMIPVAVAFLVTPGVSRRRHLAHWAAKTFLAAIGSRVRVTGIELLEAGPCVVVANHASYLDGIILTAALPPRFSFLIKHEMAAVPFAGFVLRRLGSEFVDRESAGHRHRTARRLLAAASDGDAFVVFPEGTFDQQIGLRRFQRGAFLAAWRGKSSVAPAVIRGARRKLPAGAWLPAPGPLAVTICAPLPARAYPDAMALLAATRAALLAQLGEPDLTAPSSFMGAASRRDS
jgi:1-acyl-sn-glycerol-3-phosphate acyltransferase